MDNYIITISRQLGAGGSVTGRAISEKFGFKYMDNEILRRAAEELGTDADDMKLLEESTESIWNTVLGTSVGEMPYMSEGWYVPTGRQLFETQTELMRRAVEEDSCVLLGRCGSYIFRNEKKHIAIMLYADIESRLNRLAYKESFRGEGGLKALQKEDKNRARYFNTYTGKRWMDMECYDICLDTSKMTNADIVDIVVMYICERFPELKDRCK